MTEAICETYYLACMKFGDRFGRPLPDRVLEIGSDNNGWGMALNPTESGQIMRRGLGSFSKTALGPFCLLILWNGWPAAILDATGGVFAAGSVANEESFLEWLKNGTG